MNSISSSAASRARAGRPPYRLVGMCSRGGRANCTVLLLSVGQQSTLQDIGSWVGLLSTLGPGFHYAVIGLALVVVFAVCVWLQAAALPLALPESSVCPSASRALRNFRPCSVRWAGRLDTRKGNLGCVALFCSIAATREFLLAVAFPVSVVFWWR